MVRGGGASRVTLARAPAAASSVMKPDAPLSAPRLMPWKNARLSSCPWHATHPAQEGSARMVREKGTSGWGGSEETKEKSKGEGRETEYKGEGGEDAEERESQRRREIKKTMGDSGLKVRRGREGRDHISVKRVSCTCCSLFDGSINPTLAA